MEYWSRERETATEGGEREKEAGDIKEREIGRAG
jgi:hypothetical protein